MAERRARHGFGSSKRYAQQGFISLRRFAQHGFTLIEMMVALAVFSLAALALMRLEGQTIRTTATLDATMVAQMVARNVAVEALTNVRPPVSGTTTGQEDNGGRQWSWTRTASPLGDQGAMRISIDVRDPDGASLGHLIVVRPPPPPPTQQREGAGQ